MPTTSLLPSAFLPEHLDSAETEKRLREDLELIAYVTSHDLQAPLRMIQSCCEELSHRPAYNADMDAREAVQALARETAHMKTLMQGLLDYIRLETFTPAQSMQDCNELVAIAIASLEDTIKATGAIVRCETLPTVMGHRGRLRRLFSYLLENALTFHSRQNPIVIISAQCKRPMWEFCVADNGIGIDEEHHEIIFRLFQRLHTREDYPGNGIGLGLSRKIVEAHGGHMRVESTPGNGSRFYFTIPAESSPG